MHMLSLLASPIASSGDHDHWWVVAPFVWSLWLVAVVAVVWLLARRSRQRCGGDRPKAILAERLARGEISVEEFRERLEELR
jgi:putative membrane protein